MRFGFFFYMFFLSIIYFTGSQLVEPHDPHFFPSNEEQKLKHSFSPVIIMLLSCAFSLIDVDVIVFPVNPPVMKH